MSNFIDPVSDLFVKYLLGKLGNEKILLSFVNAVLSDYHFAKISEVEIQNPFNIPDIESGKFSILDLKAKDEQDRWINVEVQTSKSSNFVPRSLYYTCKLYGDQLVEGESYSKLNPVIVINLLSFNLFELNKAHTCFKFKELSEKELVLSDDLQVHFIEVPKLSFMSENTLKLWIEYFTFEGRDQKKMAEIIEQNSDIKAAHQAYTHFTRDPDLRALWDSRERAERDRITALEEAKIEGKIEGKLEGKLEGKIEGKMEVAKIMIVEGAKNSFISKVTGLSAKAIEELRKSHK